MLNNKGFCEMTNNDLYEVNGGAWWLEVAFEVVKEAVKSAWESGRAKARSDQEKIDAMQKSKDQPAAANNGTITQG